MPKLLSIRGTRSHLSGEDVWKRIVTFVNKYGNILNQEFHPWNVVQIIRDEFKYHVSSTQLDELLDGTLKNIGYQTP